mgnify:FL=1
MDYIMFKQMPLPQQIKVIKEMADIAVNTGDPYVTDDLFNLIELMEVPEIIGINEIEGIA